MPKDKYEKIYTAQRHALGEPSPEVVAYFDENAGSLRVLDLGAGQGRDSLHIARAGHQVHAVDISPTGLAQLAEDAGGLAVTTEVADLNAYQPEGPFDVILIDRTLHMVGVPLALDAIGRLATTLAPSGEIYIIDEKSNVPAFTLQLEREGLEVIRQTPRSVMARRPPPG